MFLLDIGIYFEFALPILTENLSFGTTTNIQNLNHLLCKHMLEPMSVLVLKSWNNHLQTKQNFKTTNNFFVNCFNIRQKLRHLFSFKVASLKFMQGMCLSVWPLR